MLDYSAGQTTVELLQMWIRFFVAKFEEKKKKSLEIELPLFGLCSLSSLNVC